MTEKQKQLILCCFDLIQLEEVDGIWGEQSAAATRELQRGLGIEEDGDFGNETRDAAFERLASGEPLQNVPDNNVGNNTGTFWDEIKYFKRTEHGIACPCGRCGGFPVEPHERLIRNADAVREHFGRPMIPSSTVRCDLHNASLPGSAANSLHKRGKAMDFGIPGVAAATIVEYVWTLPDVNECYPIDDSYVHMGVLKYK